MHVGQHQHGPLPSSTRSRRASGNHAARPGLHQAEYGRAAPQRPGNLGSSPTGVSLQSWARQQYEASTQQQQQQQQQQQPPPRSPVAAQGIAPAPMFQAQYHFAPRTHAPVARPQSSGRETAHARLAPADYIDPYQDTPRGQTLNVDAGAASPKSGGLRSDAARPNAPSSPVMRAVRHSRPTTPNSAGAASASSSREFPVSAMPLPVDSPAHARLKPRSYTATEDAHHRPAAQASPPALFPPRPSPQQLHQLLQPRPRVGDTHAPDSAVSAAPVPAAQMRVEFGHVDAKRIVSGAAAQQPRATSELANAAIRDFVDMKASWAQKRVVAQKASPPAPAAAQPKQQQWPRQHAEPGSKISPETSHLIEFIERQRARTMADSDAERGRQYGAAKADAAPKGTLPGASPGMSSTRSDSSERSFKRSTTRLADVGPEQSRPAPAAPAADRGYRYTSWYDPPVRVPSADPGSTHSSPGIGPVAESRPILAPAAAGLPPSTRIVPRTRAQTTVDDAPQLAPTQPLLLPPPLPATGGGGVTNRRGERLSRGSHDSLLPPKPRVYSRQTQVDAAAASIAGTSVNPYARNPQHLSVGVQTDEAPALQPLVIAKPETRSRGVQTAKATIHGDDTVLDLMRQLDSLRQGHANQISEYQEQAVDLELLNQDLQTEVEQLTHKLEAREAAHKQAAAEMRQRLDDANSRVDREIGEMKGMHAAKCDELADQVSMLLTRCEVYRQRLVSLGVDEDELLGIAAQASAQGRRDSGRVRIADQAFIETQYVETRESSQEANYFKQLMDIERSMENTTMALGFELKRTQAKYLEHAADFIREQMARLQSDARSESRLSARAESRLSIRRGPAPAATPDLPGADAGPAARCKSPVQSLAATLSQLAAAPAMPPLPPAASRAAAAATAPRQPQLRHTHQRIVGPEPADSGLGGPPTTTAVPPAAEMRPKQPATLSAAFPAALAAAAAATRQQQPAGGSLGRLDARRAEWESRASGLSRMIASASEREAPSPATSISAGSGGSDMGDSMDGLPLLDGNAPRRCHRSPLAGIANGFFSSSQESMATAVAASEPAASLVSVLGLADAAAELSLSSPHPSLATPPKPRPVAASGSMSALTASKLLPPIVTKGASVGYYAGQRKASVADSADGLTASPTLQPTGSSLRPTSIHWPPRSERKGPSRPHSVANGDVRDMTAEELLESLKLPPSGALGLSTPTRSRFGSLPRSPTGPGGSLGRSQLPRCGSYGDLSRTLPAAPRFAAPSESDSSTLPTCTANSMASDPGFTPLRLGQTSVGSSPSVTALTAVFDPKAEVHINLGLDKSPPRPPSSLAAGAGSTRSHRRHAATRRRSRSVASWDRF